MPLLLYGCEQQRKKHSSHKSTWPSSSWSIGWHNTFYGSGEDQLFIMVRTSGMISRWHAVPSLYYCARIDLLQYWHWYFFGFSICGSRFVVCFNLLSAETSVSQRHSLTRLCLWDTDVPEWWGPSTHRQQYTYIQIWTTVSIIQCWLASVFKCWFVLAGWYERRWSRAAS